MKQKQFVFLFLVILLLGSFVSAKLSFGTGKDASIYYNGTNLIINPKEVGSGILDVQGTLQTDGYNSADGTAGATVTITLASITTITVKNGLITAWS